MRNHIMPTPDLTDSREECTFISMTELESRIEKLDATQQKIVSYYISGFTIDEISQILDTPQENVEHIIRHFTEELLEKATT